VADDEDSRATPAAILFVSPEAKKLYDNSFESY